MIKILTHLYVLHQNEVFIEQYKGFDYGLEVQNQIDAIVKLVYFEDEGFLEVDIRDLIECSSQVQRGMSS